MAYTSNSLYSVADQYHPIEKPLFILGNLRGGSPFLHEMLSRDSQTLASLTTRDISLTPFITRKMITQFFARLDASLLGPRSLGGVP